MSVPWTSYLVCEKVQWMLLLIIMFPPGKTELCDTHDVKWYYTKLDTDLHNIWTSSACVWALLSQYPFPRDCCWHCVAGLQKLKIFCDSANLPGWWLWQSASPKTLLPAQECLPRYFVTFMYVTPSRIFADLAKLQKMGMTLYWWCFTDLLWSLVTKASLIQKKKKRERENKSSL